MSWSSDPNAERRDLWELPCSSVDAVLWTTFTAEELHRECTRLGVSPIGDERATAEVRMFAPAHRLCREPSMSGDHLGDRLDEIHREAITWVLHSNGAELIEYCLGDLDDLPHSLPGVIWAVARDPRADLRPIESMLVWRAQTEGLRSLTFGRVELVEVA
ncbi:MAG: hypothetical protein AAF517_04065 [Planctomycetota bacterium]